MAIPATHCEAKKHAYRQTQDGIVVSFVLHPNEVPDDLALAPLGTRYMLALVRIGDDETPQPPEKPDRPARPFRSLPRSQQAGILCNNEMFQKWVSQTHGYVEHGGGEPFDYPESCMGARQFVLDECDIKSRRELDNAANAPAGLWDHLVIQFETASGRTTEARG